MTQPPAHNFVRYIVEVCKTPGARADLRRGLKYTPDSLQALRSHRYLAPFTNTATGSTRQAVLYATAAYIATFQPRGHPDVAPRRLGEALAHATQRGPDKPSAAASGIEKKLLIAGRATVTPLLYAHLPALLGVPGVTDQPLDWEKLTEDLLNWQGNSCAVIRRWMQYYYRTKDHLLRQAQAASDGRASDHDAVLLISTP